MTRSDCADLDADFFIFFGRERRDVGSEGKFCRPPLSISQRAPAVRDNCRVLCFNVSAKKKKLNETNKDEPGGKRRDDVQMQEDATTTISSSSGQRGSGIKFKWEWCGTGVQFKAAMTLQQDTSNPEEESGTRRVDSNRKAEREHEEDHEREDGKWTRTEENQRKTSQKENASLLRKTVTYMKTLEGEQTGRRSLKERKMSWKWEK